MSPLVIPVVTFLARVFEERIKTKSTIDGTVIATTAATVAADAVPGVPSDSLEGQILAVVLGLIGIYRILKKEKPKDA